MEELDRLVWAEGFAFNSYGVTSGVRVSDSDAIRLVGARLPPDWKPSSAAVVERLYSIVVGGPGSRPGIRRMSLAYENSFRIARSADLRVVLDAVETHVKEWVAEASPRRTFVHAGAVGWHGHGILIPGRTLSGKTHLVRELVKAGAMYYSDEYAVLDASGLLHPYARSPSVRENGRFERQTLRSVEEFGGTAGLAPLPVGLVVATIYKEGASWRPRTLARSEGMLALLANTVSARRQPHRAMAALREATARAKGIKGTRGEAEAVVDSIFKYLG